VLAEVADSGYDLTHAGGPTMNPRTPEVALPVVAEMQAEVSRRGPRRPASPAEPPRTAQPEQEGTPAVEEQTEPPACHGPGAGSFLFDDPYWDDAFDSYHNPTLRTCCRS
jgi:hypothetical protein